MPFRSPRRRRGEVRPRDVRIRARQRGAQRRLLYGAAGSKVALVGRTGSGKTTLSALLGRFYDPGSWARGSRWRRLAGRDDPQRALRGGLRLPGELPLQRLNRAQHRVFGPQRADRSDQEAARVAHAHEFIDRMPNKYNSVIGRVRRESLRRTAAAAGHRPGAPAQPPASSCSTDALSAVDPETEAQIRQELEKTDGRAHGLPDYQPHLHRPPGRHDPGARTGAHRAERHARRIDADAGVLPGGRFKPVRRRGGRLGLDLLRTWIASRAASERRSGRFKDDEE